MAKFKLVAALSPVTHADCAKDYADHNTPETAAAAREQRGQAQVDGNAAGGRWHGRKP